MSAQVDTFDEKKDAFLCAWRELRTEILKRLDNPTQWSVEHINELTDLLQEGHGFIMAHVIERKK